MRGDKSFLGILPSDKSQNKNLEIIRDHVGHMISKGVDKLWKQIYVPSIADLKHLVNILIKI